MDLINDPTFIREMKHTTDGPWHQYAVLLAARGYGWEMMLSWADYMAQADLQNISQVTTSSMGTPALDVTDSYHAHGDKCCQTPELKAENGMLTIAGISQTLEAPVKILWVNQTNTLRFFTTINDEELMNRYIETVIRRTFDQPDAMKAAMPLPKEAPPTAPKKEKQPGHIMQTVLFYAGLLCFLSVFLIPHPVWALAALCVGIACEATFGIWRHITKKGEKPTESWPLRISRCVLQVCFIGIFLMICILAIIGKFDSSIPDGLTLVWLILVMGALISYILREYLLARKQRQKKQPPAQTTQKNPSPVSEACQPVCTREQNIYIDSAQFRRWKNESALSSVYEYQGSIPLTEKDPILCLYEDGVKTREYCLQTENDEDFTGKFFLISVRLSLLGNPAIPAAQIDGFISDTPEDRKMTSADVGYRMEGHFLACGGDAARQRYEMMRGQDLPAKALKYPGYTTPSNVRLIGVCPECKKSFAFHGYAFYMQQYDVAYSSDGLDCCVIQDHNIDPKTWVHQAGGKTFRYYNAFCCPHCGEPYIDYKAHPESKVFGVSGCVHLGRNYYKAE